MTFKPLSARGKTGTRFDTLHEGVPPWLRGAVRDWLRPFVSWYEPDGEHGYNVAWLRDFELRMHVNPPFGEYFPQRAHDFFDRVFPADLPVEAIGLVEPDDGEFALDVLDYALRHLSEACDYTQEAEDRAADLDGILRKGGSAWEVSPLSDGHYALTRRVLGPVRETIEDVATVAERAGAHLVEAWQYLAGRNPLPDQAYFHAVLAVEAAAKPVVIPNDPEATLGRVIGTIRTTRTKWRFLLGDPADVAATANLLWSTHRRHGTDDREAPMGMSAEESDAGVHLALTLVRWFASGAFRRET